MQFWDLQSCENHRGCGRLLPLAARPAKEWISGDNLVEGNRKSTPLQSRRLCTLECRVEFPLLSIYMALSLCQQPPVLKPIACVRYPDIWYAHSLIPLRRTPIRVQCREYPSFYASFCVKPISLLSDRLLTCLAYLSSCKFNTTIRWYVRRRILMYHDAIKSRYILHIYWLFTYNLYILISFERSHVYQMS